MGSEEVTVVAESVTRNEVQDSDRNIGDSERKPVYRWQEGWNDM